MLRDLRDGGKVEHGSGCWANLTCAESEKQEVVDELLVFSLAKFLRRESGLHVKVPNINQSLILFLRFYGFF